jgi:hypothetical protein
MFIFRNLSAMVPVWCQHEFGHLRKKRSWFAAQGREVRRLVRRMRVAMPWLEDADEPAARDGQRVQPFFQNESQ